MASVRPHPLAPALRVIAASLLVGLLWVGRGLLAPLCLAAFVAVALNPSVSWLSRRMRRGAAAAIVVTTTLSLLVGTAYGLSDEAARAIEGMPAAARQLRQTIQNSTLRDRGPLASLDRAIAEMERLWTSSSQAPPAAAVDIRQHLLTIATGAVGSATQTVAMIFLIYFLLATGDSLKLKLVRLSGERLSNRKVTVQAVDQLATQMGRFVAYLLISGAVVGMATWAVFSWMGMAYASLWGLAAGLLNCVPYLGPTAVMGASAIAAAVQFQSLGMGAAAGGASLAITSIEGMLLGPALFGRIVRIHPVAIFLSIMFWGWLWGPIGTFLAVPIVTAIKTVVDLFPDAAQASEVLADAGEETVGR